MNYYLNKNINILDAQRLSNSEFGCVAENKDKKKSLKILLAYPDLYEIGMSYYGLRLIYSLLNSQKDFLADRCFLPSKQTVDYFKNNKISLKGLETGLKADEFDVICFFLNTELNFTNVLAFLELSQLGIDRKKRKFPMIIAGGMAVVNPMPLKKFIDIFYIGEAEKYLLEILLIINKNKDLSKTKLLDKLSDINCLYIPEHREENIKRAISKTIENDNIEQWLTPFLNILHNRVYVEIARGCSTNCRFCLSNFYYRPFRIKNKQTIIQQSLDRINFSGYEDLTLLSLNSCLYPGLKQLIIDLKKTLPYNTGISIPSIQVNRFDFELIEILSSTRKLSNMTFAIEAGSERLRNVIGKNVDINKLYSIAYEIFRKKFKKLKLYFMIGLPTETSDDIKEMCNILCELNDIAYKSKYGSIRVGISNFIPKPFTPFQWHKFMSEEYYYNTVNIILSTVRKLKNVYVEFNDYIQSKIEASLSLASDDKYNIIERAYNSNAFFDQHKELLNKPVWNKLLSDKQYNYSINENLPWEEISLGASKQYLKREYTQAIKTAKESDVCKPLCRECGVCNNLINLDNIKKYKERETNYQPEILNEKQETVWLRMILKIDDTVSNYSQTDIFNSLIRIFKRLKIDLKFSQGFNKRPKIKLGPAREMYVKGLEICEVLMYKKSAQIMLENFQNKNQEKYFIHKKISIIKIEKVEKSFTKTLKSLVYRIKFNQRIESRIDEQTIKQMIVVKKGKTYKLEECINSIEIKNQEIIIELKYKNNGLPGINNITKLIIWCARPDSNRRPTA